MSEKKIRKISELISHIDSFDNEYVQFKHYLTVMCYAGYIEARSCNSKYNPVKDLASHIQYTYKMWYRGGFNKKDRYSKNIYYNQWSTCGWHNDSPGNTLYFPFIGSHKDSLRLLYRNLFNITDYWEGNDNIKTIAIIKKDLKDLVELKGGFSNVLFWGISLDDCMVELGYEYKQ
jgi:hypothetical protein